MSDSNVNSETSEATGASSDRFDREGDWEALQFFSSTDLQMSPDEYAARHAHEWGCFSLHLCRFRDPVLGAWIRRFGEIIFSAEELDRCRKRFLTPEEVEEIKRQQAEGL
jgi:hypothetical protein